ncbi:MULTISPECIES: hypothetical protein [unclassified Romboutsia]|uniref:hypothetical protein n=1 Tax=unclassified Romboutsia TaxID=2626894 RepID=UPI001896C162|nr:MULTISPECIES: hypothetical protein [unclassified Romboutsia]MDB8805942.1 hypothetical protein [Romboutsia sp. 1001216sp1]MDB8807614.1 hypothetical protein [Romboutsia sp. 1001216sp1]MDB8811237.1 hypothetical protein [Romboutsia sp. 1001216sp1]MDB8816957.1 hypothetical protein [Romboutsia sp. 1001216sp1]MDB8819525.1 hypothetical protein [Romboutsia sp. 1001216sp1]
MKLSKRIIVGLISAAVILIGGKFVYDNFIDDDFTYPLTYISIEGNKREKDQIDTIEKSLESNKCKFEEINFEMLKVDDKNNMVIKESEYNKLANKLDLEKVKVNDKEAAIIPRYDGIKNFKYMNELKELTNYKVENNNLKVVGVVDKKILITGLFKSQIIISDNLYNKLEKDSENKIVTVKGYEFKENSKSDKAILQIKENKSFSNNNENDLFYLFSK